MKHVIVCLSFLMLAASVFAGDLIASSSARLIGAQDLYGRLFQSLYLGPPAELVINQDGSWVITGALVAKHFQTEKIAGGQLKVTQIQPQTIAFIESDGQTRVVGFTDWASDLEKTMAKRKWGKDAVISISLVFDPYATTDDPKDTADLLDHEN